MSEPTGIVLSVAAVAAVALSVAYAYVRKGSMTLSLVVSNVAVFVLCIFSTARPGMYTITSPVVQNLGFRPEYLLPENFLSAYTLVTSAFLHADPIHLVMNMLVMALVALPFEERVGRSRLLAVYLVTGALAPLLHSAFNWGGATLLIGASGAIFGILGAFAVLYPNDRIVMPVIFIFMRVPVYAGALIFAALETVYAISMPQGNTSHFAHLGGFIAGVLLAVVLRKTGIAASGRTGVGKTAAAAAGGRVAEPDYEKLLVLAKTDPQKEMVKKMRDADVADVRDAWMEHFVSSLECPNCKRFLSHDTQKGRLICGCGYEMFYRK